MKKIFYSLALCFFVNISFSQTTGKGSLYSLWGWNRGFYTHSNISFKGQDYDFKLRSVKAHDKLLLPVNFHNYLEFARMTIPQTDFKIGYFIKNGLSLSAGFDHMKYVMTQDQVVRMTGEISQPGPYKGEYNGDKVLSEDFLTFEHTDGLNLINVEIEKYVNLYHSKSNQFNIDALFGGGGGVMYPKTNVKLLNYERNDRFHISGFGLMAKAGIQATFFKHLIIKFENKYGYINMPDIILHKKGIPGRAKQAFWFTEFDGMIGGTINLNKKKKK